MSARSSGSNSARVALPALVIALALAPLADAGDRTRVILGDSRLGSYRVKVDGSLAGAVAAFGEPSRIRRGSRYREFCYVSWRQLGPRIIFYNLGLANPCQPQSGRFYEATITSRADWRTSKGLRIGDAVRGLRRLYPRARRQGNWWSLVVRRSPYGDNALYAGLAAKAIRGRVVALVVSYQAGGD